MRAEYHPWHRLRAAIFALTFVLGTAAGATVVSAGDGEGMQTVDALRTDLRQKEHFALPDAAEAEAARRASADLVADIAPPGEILDAAGLTWHRNFDWQALGDTPARPAGRGLFVHRSGGLPMLLSAPHQFHDIETGRIAAQLFDDLQVAAAAFNTAPRSLSLPDGRKTDLGKLEGTHFNLFHLAFHAAYPKGRIVQIHGFAAEKRSSQSARSAELILSNGTRHPDPGTVATVECLRRAGFRTLLYPDDVTELGGTQNATLAELLRAGAPVGTFLHVEISRAMRDRLVVDDALRFVFGTCLGVSD